MEIYCRSGIMRLRHLSAIFAPVPFDIPMFCSSVSGTACLPGRCVCRALAKLRGSLGSQVKRLRAVRICGQIHGQVLIDAIHRAIGYHAPQ